MTATMIQVDYIALMCIEKQVGGAPTRFSMHHDGDKPTLIEDGRLSFIFVLQGELRFSFIGGIVTNLTAQQVMVIDKAQLRELQCVGNTVIMECVESDKMSPLMQAASRVFGTPCSEIITLNSKLNAWCKGIFMDLQDTPHRSNDYHRCRCKELTALLLEYHPNVLGTLYVPLYACSNHCKTCTRLFVQEE